MRAALFVGPHDIDVGDRPDAGIVDPTDAVVRVVLACVCGSDLWYLTGIALPMVLIGIGQGGALGPLTAGGLAGVSAEDAGAAGGVTNVAHQIGGSLGLVVLVAVFAAADAGGTLHDGALLTHRIAASLTAGAALLALALLIALAVRPRRKPAARPAADVRPAAIRAPALEASDALLER